MNAIHTLIVVIQVISALAIIGLVLLQHGKGADMGAAFGSGASGSLLGATGSSNFLSKFTGVAAAIFFAATLALAFLGGRDTNTGAGVMENVTSIPVAPPSANKKAFSPASSKNSGVQQAPASKTNDQSNQIPR